MEHFGKISKKRDILIEGLQSAEDHALMVEMFGPKFRHVHLEIDSQPATLFNAVREPEPNEIRKHQKSYIKSDSKSIKPLADYVLIYNGENSDLMSQLDAALNSAGG
jgi:hypothetical protein